jgi:penicillin G amidase
MALVLLLFLVGFGALYIVWELQGSLPLMEGEYPLKGLSAAVLVERDDEGVPTLSGQTREDLSRAMGFIHAQDRFFQMDLMRRQSAGELAELFGKVALSKDRSHRVHRFRYRAKHLSKRLKDAQKRMLNAYTHGVNAGLNALRSAPFEYHILRQEPVPWRNEDSLLVVYTMYLTLQSGDTEREALLGVLKRELPDSVYRFLTPLGSKWDAALDGSVFSPEQIPSLKRVHQDTKDTQQPDNLSPDAPAPGSNAWAIAGFKTPHGGAILANDMHLPLSYPNTWYRLALRYPSDDTHTNREIIGISLPGTPIIVAGSNGHIAWGFTNSYGDWHDLVILEEGKSPGTYLTPTGEQPLRMIQEHINVRSQSPDILEVHETIWGPLVDVASPAQSPMALRWVAHDKQAINFMLLELEPARTTQEALAIAKTIRMPAQNIIVADKKGHIGWTIAGAIPKRIGFDGRTPQSWANGEKGWFGWLEAVEHPTVYEPPDGILWSANARMIGAKEAKLLGDGGYALGARAQQIRDRLRGLTAIDEINSLNLQLDDRSLFLTPWKDLAITLLGNSSRPLPHQHQEFLKQLAQWSGRASADSVAFNLVRRFRLEVRERTFTALLDHYETSAFALDYYHLYRQNEAPLWTLITEKPSTWHPPAFSSWDEFLLGCIDASIQALTADGHALSELSWGRYNQLTIGHPLLRALPFLKPWLSFPSTPMPGAKYMPRVQQGQSGASMRMVVSPGREDEGYFHMPTAQSPHPLSPNSKGGHEAWVQGAATPFKPGPPLKRLRLITQ